jgi:hypothetical protein
MAQLKYWNGSAWVAAAAGAQGSTGETGPAGPTGAAGVASTVNVGLIASGSLNTGTSLTVTELNADFIQIHLYGLTTTGNTRVLVRPNNSSSAVYDYNKISGPGTNIMERTQNGTSFDINAQRTTDGTSNENYFVFNLTNCKSAGFTTIQAESVYLDEYTTGGSALLMGIYKAAQQITSVTITTSTGTTFNGAGTYKVFGG